MLPKEVINVTLKRLQIQGRRGDFEIFLVPKYEALSTGTTITLYSG